MKPKILLIIPYKFIPPINGGTLRSYYMLLSLLNDYDLFLLTTHSDKDFELSKLKFPPNVQILANKGFCYRSLFNLLGNKIGNAINTKYILRSFTAKANSYLLETYQQLNRVKDVKFDVVIYENIESFSLLKGIMKNINKNILHIVNAHNIDSSLWNQKATVEKSSLYLNYAKKAFKIESNLYRSTNLVFTCSQIDQKRLNELNKNKLNSVLIPNGVDLENRKFDNSESKFSIKEILFCGSLETLPNRQGIFWFYNFVFKELKKIQPDVELCIIGQLENDSLYHDLKLDPCVKFIGQVNDVSPYYLKTSVSIVPLLSGSGTRLKILEAMAFGNPVVSTSIGAEGIEYVNGKNIMIADSDIEFAKCIHVLLSDKLIFDNLRYTAFDLVKKNYDWHEIGKKININISNLINNR